MVELERRGIPTVLFTAQTFVHDAHRSAASFGLAGLPLAVVPLPFTNQKPEDGHRMAEAAPAAGAPGARRRASAPSPSPNQNPGAPPGWAGAAFDQVLAGLSKAVE